MKRYEIQVDDLEIEPDAIFDTKTKTLYECCSSGMNELCKLLNTEDIKWQKLKEFISNRPDCAGYDIKHNGYQFLFDILDKIQELEEEW